MTCKQVQSLLSRFQDGEVAQKTGAVLEAHLAGCNRCRQELNSLRQLENRLRSLPPRLATGNFTPRVMARVRERRQGRRGFTLPGFVYSLVFSIFLILGLLVVSSLTREPADRGEESYLVAVLEEGHNLGLINVQEDTLALAMLNGGEDREQ